MMIAAQIPLYAFSLANEKCWSANPILKSSDESKKLVTEQQLCSMDFYQGEFSVCPKLNSTNPGVLVIKRLIDIPDLEFRKKYCANVDEANESGKLKVVAKFKQTISCSNASSPVAYYRIAEFLNGPRVPVAVFRTMDSQKHLEITEQALSNVATIPTELIAQNWRRFFQLHKIPGQHPEIFVDGTVYGALVENIKSEFQYTEVSGAGSYETRYQRFMERKPFQLVANSASIKDLAGSSFKTLAPILTQMKDVSNMIVIDHMLNQADRIGNIHFKYKWYKYENAEVSEADSKSKHIRGQAVIPATELSHLKAGEVLVKEMVLKDNDCGISKENEMKKAGALNLIRHMSPKVYKQVQKLAAFIQTQEGINYFKNELRISEGILLNPSQGIRANILDVAKTLKSNCESGALSLDLNLEALLANPNFKGNCQPE